MDDRFGYFRLHVLKDRNGNAQNLYHPYYFYVLLMLLLSFIYFISEGVVGSGIRQHKIL